MSKSQPRYYPNVTRNVNIVGSDTETLDIASSADISSGVHVNIGKYAEWTLYLKSAGETSITVELSPDEGKTWYRIVDDIEFSTAGDKITYFGYQGSRLRLTSSNTEDVTAQIWGVS